MIDNVATIICHYRSLQLRLRLFLSESFVLVSSLTLLFWIETRLSIDLLIIKLQTLICLYQFGNYPVLGCFQMIHITLRSSWQLVHAADSFLLMHSPPSSVIVWQPFKWSPISHLTPSITYLEHLLKPYPAFMVHIW